MKLLDNTDKKVWNDVLESSPHSTIFHELKWLKIVEKTFNVELYPYIIYKEETPIGIVPLFMVKKFHMKFCFSPPIRTAIPFLGPIFSNYLDIKQNKKEQYIRAVSILIDDFLRKNNVKYFSMVFPPEFLDIRPFLWNKYYVVPRFNYVFNLMYGKEYLWKRMKKGLRKNIIKTSKKVDVRNGDEDDLKFIYKKVFERYREQKRKLSINMDYISKIYRNFKNNIQILVAEKNGKRISGMVNLKYKDCIYSWLGNTKTDLKGIYPNDLIIWKSIESGCENGYKYFYEIGANTPRIVRYKANFNPELTINFAVIKKNLLGKISENIYKMFRRLK